MKLCEINNSVSTYLNAKSGFIKKYVIDCYVLLIIVLATHDVGTGLRYNSTNGYIHNRNGHHTRDVGFELITIGVFYCDQSCNFTFWKFVIIFLGH